MSKGTPHRPIRISDELWAKAQAKAAQEGTTASEVIRRALELYTEDQHPTWASEVTAANTAHIATCPQCQETFHRT